MGRRGEEQVRQAMERKGVEILDTNWRSPYGELDLVAATKTDLLFIEVKTRTSARSMEAREAVTRSKQKRLYLTAQCWLMEHPEEHRQPRFDVAEVYRTGPEQEAFSSIRYYPNAFDGSDLDL